MKSIQIKMNAKILSAVLFAIAVWLFFDLNVPAQSQSSTPETNPEIARVLTIPPPPGFATRLDYLKSFTSEKAIINAYHAGLLTNDVEIMMALQALGNKASVDTYGKVVDQNGQPVVGAKVQGYVDLGFGDSEKHDTETDAKGQFHFLGLHGKGLGIGLQKKGYEYGYKIPYQRPGDYLPDLNNPVVITMWKLRGAEPMTHSKLHAYIPCDGSVTKFDLLTGKKNPDGDLIVNLTRNPLNIDRRRPFNWSVTLEIPNGGFQEITNLLYPNEAPTEGYQSKMTLNFPTNMVGWQSSFNHAYYFKSKDGQIYGRMDIEIMADFQPPPTLFDVEIYANPAGSRNLEFDWKKQIR
jgi:hypothetical protein